MSKEPIDPEGLVAEHIAIGAIEGVAVLVRIVTICHPHSDRGPQAFQFVIEPGQALHMAERLNHWATKVQDAQRRHDAED
jgi:hypothetical protein